MLLHSLRPEQTPGMCKAHTNGDWLATRLQSAGEAGEHRRLRRGPYV